MPLLATPASTPSATRPTSPTAAADALMRCPGCRGELRRTGDALACACGASYPIVRGVPVLIHEPRSIFTIAEVVNDASSISPTAKSVSLKSRILEALPQISKNWAAPDNFRRMTEVLRARPGHKRVLVIGGGVLGYGMESLVGDPNFSFVETDVFVGPRTTHVADAHDLPFVDGAFDAVIMQGVLGALLDPNRAVAEIHRVLKPQGVVYIETPFVQQVCMGRFDFQRYSHLGLRRLFRQFDELHSGAQAGPGMSMAWAWQYLLWSAVTTTRGRAFMVVVARLTSWWLKYLDGWLLRKPAAFDAASGVFFLGTKGERVLSDRELIRLYRGGYA